GTAPPAQAAKSSETAPSAHEARSEARTDPTWRPASPRRAAGPGTGAAARAGALPGSDSPGCGTEGAEATRSIGWRGVLFSTFSLCRLRYRALTRSPARLFQAVRARRQRSSNRARGRRHASSLAGGLSAVSAIGSVSGRGRSMSARHPRPRESSSEEQINGILIYQFNGIADGEVAAVDHVAVEGHAPAELRGDAAQDTDVLHQRVGIERRHHTTRAELGHRDDSFPDAEPATGPGALSQV